MTDEQFEAFIKSSQDLLRHLYESGSAVSCSEAHLLCRNGKNGEKLPESNAILEIAAFIDGLGDAETRFETQRLVRDQDAFAVMVKLEAWFVEIPKDADEGLRARLEYAAETQTIDKLEPPHRREKVIVHFESEDHPIRIMEAEIFRAGDGRKPGLGEWKPPQYEIRLPRPSFRRYVSEVQDGKRTLGLSVPGCGTVRLVYGDAKK
jgi:hypothetical protein